MNAPNHGALLRTAGSGSARGAQVVSPKDAGQDQNGGKDPQSQPEGQPIAVRLAELAEPVVLERNV